MGTGVSASQGFTGTLNYAEFAALANRDPFAGTECLATAGTGTRQAVVAAGSARVHNTLHAVSGATLSLAENTSGKTRIDLICLLVDWTANSGAGDASLVAVAGTPAASPVAPYASLSTTPGTAWHEPIAEVTVASGAGVLTSSAFQDVRAGPWITPVLTSPITNYGGSWSAAGFRKTSSGLTVIRGLVAGAPMTYPGMTALTLPTPFRPPYSKHITTVYSNGGQERMGILQPLSSGKVNVRTLVQDGNQGAAAWLSIECTFST